MITTRTIRILAASLILLLVMSACGDEIEPAPIPAPDPTPVSIVEQEWKRLNNDIINYHSVERKNLYNTLIEVCDNNWGAESLQEISEYIDGVEVYKQEWAKLQEQNIIPTVFRELWENHRSMEQSFMEKSIQGCTDRMNAVKEIPTIQITPTPAKKSVADLRKERDQIRASIISAEVQKIEDGISHENENELIKLYRDLEDIDYWIIKTMAQESNSSVAQAEWAFRNKAVSDAIQESNIAILQCIDYGRPKHLEDQYSRIPWGMEMAKNAEVMSEESIKLLQGADTGSLKLQAMAIAGCSDK